MKFAYIDEIRKLLDTIEREENETMEKAVSCITNAILNKHAIFTFGASHAGILSEEMYYRAGGLVVMNPIFGRELMLDTTPITQTSRMERVVGYGTALFQKTPIKKDDVLIIHSVSGRNPVSIEMALEATKLGARVICITNLTYSKTVSSRHPSGKNLYEYSDIILDNHGALGDACVSIEGMKQKVSPTSTVVGATILNSIVASVTEHLIQQGLKVPPIFYSANIDGGNELNQKIFDEYKDVIHYQF
ncbi:MAG: SIS domain-containing protein [Erysipelotrichaceae bacterium]